MSALKVTAHRYALKVIGFISGPCMCQSVYGETPEFPHIMYSSRVEILPGEQECYWVYHKNHLVLSLANGFLF